MPCLAHVAHVPVMGETFPVGVVLESTLRYRFPRQIRSAAGSVTHPESDHPGVWLRLRKAWKVTAMEPVCRAGRSAYTSTLL